VVRCSSIKVSLELDVFNSGFDTLLIRDITKSSAMQRAGRAGREGPGFCFRLYTEESFHNMSVSAEPEIMRVNLALSILQLKCLGQDLEDLDLMDKPDRGASKC
jgi:ATP-dependent RNA helicase DHX33